MKKVVSVAILVMPNLSIFAQRTSTAKNDSTKTKAIEEVVIVGFGQQKKQDLTASVSIVTEKAIEGRPINNVVEALKGTAAGLSFNTGNGGGQLDNTASFSLRGAGTVGNTSSSALVLIDGMEGDPSKLNPRDVESVSILKDAAAASIYGSRAAFGVILITTKSGRKGKASVSYDLITKFNSPLLRPGMLDSESFAYYFNDAAFNSGGQSAVFSDEQIQNIKDFKSGKIPYSTKWLPERKDWALYNEGGFANTNWFKEYYRDWVSSFEHNLSVRGGSEKSTYYFSANYLDQSGLMRYNPDHLYRYSVNGKIKADILPYLNLGYSSRFIRSDYDSSPYMNGLFYHNIARRWPTVPIKDPNGNYVWGNEIPNLLRSSSENQQDFLDQNLTFILTPIKNWVTNFEFNYKIENFTTHTVYLPLSRYDDKGNAIPTYYQLFTDWDTIGGSNVSDYYWKTGFFNTNIYSTYTKTINNLHNFKFMTGMQSELYKARNFSAGKDKLLSENITVIDGTSGDNIQAGGSALHWSTFGVVSRLNYDYDKKYLAEVNVRLDASSRYLKDQRWRLYPAYSVGYNMAKENFWGNGNFLTKITQFKIRASYGELGNQNTNNFYPFYLTQPFQPKGSGWLINGQKPSTASAPGMVSTFLTWENVRTKNLGLDITSWGKRFNLKFDYFIRETLGMVGAAPELPPTLGTTPPPFNNSDLRTKGFELELSWRDRIGEDFSYGINGVLSDAQSTITRFNNVNNSLGQYYIGRKIGEIWGYTTRGIAKNQQEMDEWLKTHNQNQLGSNWSAGDIMYEDLNGDGKINGGANTLQDPGDRKIIGNNTPRYNFGFNVDLQYKTFDLSVFFQGVGKRDIAPGVEPYFIGANTNMWQSAGFVQHLDYFRPENTESPFGPNVNSYYPRPLFDGGGKNFATQTRWLQDASYIRLKNLQFGYSLPKYTLENLGINSVRIYVSAENLLTWTKLTKIYDPETIDGSWGNGKVYPLSKVIATGLTVNF